MVRIALLALAVFSLVVLPARAADKAAFFGIHFEDTSPSEDQSEELRRAEMIEEALRARLIESGRFELVDIAPVEDKFRFYENLSQCGGCDADLARELGAAYAITGEVQKTSNLILHMSIYVRDAATGDLVDGGSADMRGNTDDTWARALNHILRHRVLQ